MQTDIEDKQWAVHLCSGLSSASRGAAGGPTAGKLYVGGSRAVMNSARFVSSNASASTLALDQRTSGSSTPGLAPLASGTCCCEVALVWMSGSITGPGLALFACIWPVFAIDTLMCSRPHERKQRACVKEAVQIKCTSASKRQAAKRQVQESLWFTDLHQP